MKIAVIADCHLNKSNYKSISKNGVPFRTMDFMNSFSYICNECISSIKPDLMVLNGDTYDTDNPNNIVREFFNSWIYKLNEAKIPVIILVGNHDICKSHFPLQPLKALNLKYTKVIDTPCTYKFKDIRLLLFPYSLNVEQGKVKLLDEFRSFINECNKENNETKIFFGHFGVRGAKISTYIDKSGDEEDVLSNSDVDLEKNIVGRGENMVSLNDLDSIGAKYVFLGDYHRFQSLPTKKCFSMYSGSIERTDITERDQDKGFILYDSDIEEIEGMGKCRFIKYPNCRPMIEIKGNLQDIKKKTEDLDSSLYNAPIVKVSFIGNKTEAMDYNSEYEEVSNVIKNKLNPIYFYDVKKITDDDLDKKATELEKEILDKGNLEEIDIINVVKEIIVEKEPENQEEVLKMHKLTDDIWESVNLEMET